MRNFRGMLSFLGRTVKGLCSGLTTFDRRRRSWSASANPDAVPLAGPALGSTRPSERAWFSGLVDNIEDEPMRSPRTEGMRLMKKLLAVAQVTAVMVALAVVPARAGSALYSIAPPFQDNLLRRIDPATGATISSVPITLQGKTVLGGNGLATHPQTGQLYALLQLDRQQGRQLVTIDPV